MRLIVRQLWRAFPELDGFSDEQCAAFVKVASLSKRHALAGSLVLFGGGALGLVVVGLVSMALLNPVTTGAASVWDALWRLAAAAAVFAVAAGCVLRLRDWLLRRSVLRLFATRGACEGCGHGLAGLPADVQRVICPECSLAKALLASEAVADASGRVRFLPRPEGVAIQTPWAERLEWRRRSRRAALCVLSLVLVPLLTVGGVLGVNALTARADKVAAQSDVAQIMSLRLPFPAEVDGIIWALTEINAMMRSFAAHGRLGDAQIAIVREPEALLWAYGVPALANRGDAAAIRAIGPQAAEEEPWRLAVIALTGQGELPDHLWRTWAPSAELFKQPAEMDLFGPWSAVLATALDLAQRGQWGQAGDLIVGADRRVRLLVASLPHLSVLRVMRLQRLQLEVLARLLAERPPDVFLERMAASNVLGGTWLTDQQVAKAIEDMVLFHGVGPVFLEPLTHIWLPFFDPLRLTSSPSRTLGGIADRMTSARLGRYAKHRNAASLLRQQAERAFAQVPDQTEALVFVRTGSHMVDQFLVGGVRVVTDQRQSERTLDAIRLALAAQRFEVRHGRPAESIEELLASGLCPEGTGVLALLAKPVKLTSLGSSDRRQVTVIYSTGPDGVDSHAGADDVILFPPLSLISELGVPVRGMQASPERAVFLGTRPELPTVPKNREGDSGG
jgi:hypothetical protein